MPVCGFPQLQVLIPHFPVQLIRSLAFNKAGYERNYFLLHYN